MYRVRKRPIRWRVRVPSFLDSPLPCTSWKPGGGSRPLNMARTHRLIDPGAWGQHEPCADGVDELWMNRALDLAWHGAGRTRPNPLVGAVVIKDRSVVGEGFHEALGRDHAETVAVDRAGSAAEGGTLYATREPSAHHGRTPPCTGRIIRSGVCRVVVATLDPDRRVNGRGIAALRAHGIQVDTGVCVDGALLLNLPYFKKALGLGTAVTLKMACSLDGRIASGPGRRDTITSLDARRFVHRLRAIHDGVLVGSETLLVDRPLLDCRLLGGVTAPTPVVMDARLRFPVDYPWSRERRPFLVVSGAGGNRAHAARIAKGGGRVRTCRRQGRRLDPESALEIMAEEGVTSVLVEGGGEIFSSFVGRGTWDAMHVLVAPIVLGAEAVGLSPLSVDRRRLGAVMAGTTTHGTDVRISYLRAPSRDILLEKLLPAKREE